MTNRLISIGRQRASAPTFWELNDVIWGIEDEVDKSLQLLFRPHRREKRIMELRFGLSDGVEKTQKEVLTSSAFLSLHPLKNV